MKTFNNASLIFLSMLVYMLVDQVVIGPAGPESSRDFFLEGTFKVLNFKQ